MAISVTLRVTGIDLDDADVGTKLAAQLPLLLWQGDHSYATATFDVEERTAVVRVLDVARLLEGIAPGVEVLGTDRDLVSTTEIASRIGVSREGARKRTKEPDFPAPHSIIGGRMAAWPWAAVVDWLQESRGIDMGESLPSEKLLTQIDNVIFRNPDATTMQWRELSAIPGGARTRRTTTLRTSTTLVAEWRTLRRSGTSVRFAGQSGRLRTSRSVTWLH